MQHNSHRDNLLQHRRCMPKLRALVFTKPSFHQHGSLQIAQGSIRIAFNFVHPLTVRILASNIYTHATHSLTPQVTTADKTASYNLIFRCSDGEWCCANGANTRSCCDDSDGVFFQFLDNINEITMDRCGDLGRLSCLLRSYILVRQAHPQPPVMLNRHRCVQAAAVTRQK